MSRIDELRAKIQARVATFAVGDMIAFKVTDLTGYDERKGKGDPVEIDLVGKILSIEDHNAIVEHQWGICSTSLTIAKKLPCT
jgi:hypothetical protein